MDFLFNLFISMCSSIVVFIFGVMFIVGIFVLPLCLNGGWILYIPIFGFIISLIISIFDNNNKNDEEE